MVKYTNPHISSYNASLGCSLSWSKGPWTTWEQVDTLALFLIYFINFFSRHFFLISYLLQLFPLTKYWHKGYQTHAIAKGIERHRGHKSLLEQEMVEKI
jgi:hypothetical protein